MKKGKTLSNWMTTALKSNRDHTQDYTHDHTPSMTKKPSRRKLKRGRERTYADSDVPWITKYRPSTVTDLAVHKKKIMEVEQWLEFALSQGSRHSMLLLTGPPGCGKTATLQALAKDMDFSVLEWINPVTDTGGPATEDASSDQILFPESQSRQFQNFIIRANRYPSLMLGREREDGGGASNTNRKKKIVMVEEFPNAFLKDPNKFHQVLRSVWNSLYYPLVFVVSESHCGGYTSSNLFRKDYLSHTDIHTISFNPIAHTSIIKTLQKITLAECAGRSLKQNPSEMRCYMPAKEVIEGLAESSNGDIRSAVNSLQFICLRDSTDLLLNAPQPNLVTKRRKGSSSMSKSSLSGSRLQRQNSGCDMMANLGGIGGRDRSLFLFRALGKILYFKRDEDKGVDPLPPHLEEHERPPLLVVPELVVENTQISPGMFVLYLHENYNDFFDDLDDIANGLTYMSDSDILGQLWSDAQDVRQSMQSYSSSIACRGLIHSNRSTARGRWRPLHKPGWNSVFKQFCENCTLARTLFLHFGSSPYAHLWTPIELQTEILPFMAAINTKLRNPDQVALLQSITHFKAGHQRQQSQFLEEKDMETDQTTASYNEQSVENECLSGSQRKEAPGTVISSQGSNQSGVALSQNTRMTADDQLTIEDEIQDFDDEILW